MRIAAIYNAKLPNVNYRCIGPLRELQRRGHDVLWPQEVVGDQIDRLLDCDVVHMHRQYGPATLAVVPLLARSGVAVVYDNDDDLSAVPVESPHYETFAGDKGKRIEDAWKRILRRAALVTTTSEALADKFVEAGADQVAIIENYLPAEFMTTERREHEGVVLGWIAGTTHAADATRLELPATLRSLLEELDELHVACIGLDLKLDHPRYHHLERVPFPKLLDAAAAFDIGIAPLADIPFNRSRSNVKAKEYAALGIPWLASPVAPYLGLGAEEGGEHVAPGEWREAIIRLVRDAGERERRGALAREWAQANTIELAGPIWEDAFGRAIDSALSRS